MKKKYIFFKTDSEWDYEDVKGNLFTV